MALHCAADYSKSLQTEDTMTDRTATNTREEYYCFAENALPAQPARAPAAVASAKNRRASVLVVVGAAPACNLLRLARRQVAHRCLIVYVEQRLACVLIDLDIYGTAALEVCRRIRSLPEALDTIILLMSSQPCVETFDAALLAGADEILLKPLTTHELVARVECALSPNSHSGEELRRRCERLCQQRAELEILRAAGR
jgi:PleD family two-component response regulator